MCFQCSQRIYNDRLRPVKREMINNTKKMKNNTLAIEAAAATMLKNPKIPATMATTRNRMDHLNITLTFLSFRFVCLRPAAFCTSVTSIVVFNLPIWK